MSLASGFKGFATFTGNQHPTITNSGTGQSIALNSVILLFVQNSTTAAATSLSTVTGGGLTWTKLLTNLAYNSTDATSQHVTMEVWWAKATSAFAQSALTVTANFGASTSGILSLQEVSGADTVTPLDASGRHTNTNTSATVGAVPSVSQVTTATNTALFQFYCVSGVSSGNASSPAGWTIDAANGNTGSTPLSFMQTIHKIVSSAQAGTSTWSSTDTRWGLIEFAVVQGPPPASSTIDQTLSSPTQAATAKETIPSTIAQTLTGVSQSVAVVEKIPTTIAQTLAGVTQEIDVVEKFIAAVDQTLSGLTQEIDVVEKFIAAVDQTLAGVTQEIDVTETSGTTTAIDQTLAGFAQEIDVIEEFPTTIDQTLAGVTQEIDVDVSAGSVSATVDQTLAGITQEIHVAEDFVAVIDQTLLGGADVTADSGMVLFGIEQLIVVTEVTKSDEGRERHGGGGIAPKDPRIHPGELELFRERVYARGVAAAVPPPQIAVRQLTTPQFPASRPSTVPFISRGKPK